MKTEAQEILNIVFEFTSPEKMTKEESIDFMNDIIGDLEIMVESLEMEIEQENEL
ncbi:MAG: hypothetical protein IIC75_03340 [Bacteroidetes bacterium]|nr:hypothetical protein [Bacteroidota bacterium]